MKKIKDSNFNSIYQSCVEGLTGAWDCSTDEGREGFQAMIDCLEKLAQKYNIDTTETDKLG